MRNILLLLFVVLSSLLSAQKINSELLVNSWKMITAGQEMIPFDQEIIFKFTKNKLFIESDKNSGVLDYKVDKKNIILTNEGKKTIWSIEELDNSKLIFIDEQSVRFRFVMLNTKKDYPVLPPPPPLPPGYYDDVKVKSPEYDNVSTDVEPEIFTIIDEQPIFPGCKDIFDKTERQKCSDKKMVQFLGQNAGYPEAAREAGFEGTVFVRFVVETNGSISNIEVLKDQTPSGGLKDAALNAVRAMNNMEKKWNPGMQSGKPVRVRVVVPVKFKLDFDEPEFSIETKYKPSVNTTQLLIGKWKVISMNGEIIPEEEKEIIEFIQDSKIIMTSIDDVFEIDLWRINKDGKKIDILKDGEAFEFWGIISLDKENLKLADRSFGIIELKKI
jgi:TonB family protein